MSTIREKQFTITESGISPRQVQDVGLQGEHNATELIFTIDSALRTKLDEIASERGGELYYRLQAVDGAGAFHSSELLTVDGESGETYVITYDIPSDLTASGGLLTINIVISLIVGGESDVTEEITLYSFPCRMRFVPTEGSGDSETLYKRDITGALVQAQGFRDEAGTFASNAATSAGDAATSESNAQGYATAAGNSATAAGEAKTAAESARDLAQGYRDSAQGYANSAQTHAGRASNSADTAEGYKDTTKGYMDLAEGYKDDALSAKNAAVTAQGKAETAQGKAEDAQDAAENARDLASGYADDAQGYASDAADSATVAESAAASITPLIIERAATTIYKDTDLFIAPQLTNGDLVDIVEAVEDGRSVYLKVANSDLYYLVGYAYDGSDVTALGDSYVLRYQISTDDTSANASVRVSVIKETVVDQTYNNESTNAQSGTAVAQAISTKADRFTTYTTTETNNLLAAKADKYQGESNAGKFWKVGQDGNLTLGTVDNLYDPTSSNPQSGLAVSYAVAHIVENVATTVSGKTVPNLSATDLDDIVYYIGKRRVIVKDKTRNLYFNVLTAETKIDGYRVILAARDGSAFIDYQYTSGGSVEITVRQASVTVDQVYDSTSANAQSGVAIAGALANIPTVTVDQTYDGTSANAQSGVAVQGKLSTIPNYQTKTTVDNVLLTNTKYVLGEQNTLTLSMPTTDISLGNTIEVIFSSGSTACTLTCDLQGFSFVPQANKTNKIVFEYIATDTWTVSVKESA